MGYFFLWLETMALAWFLVAVVFSFTGRLKKLPVVWPILMAVIITVPAVLLSILSGKIFFLHIHPQWLFPYNLSWTLIFLAGTWLLIRQGQRPSREAPAAASWSRSKCTGALLILLALQWSTINSLDNTSMVKATAAQTMALTRTQAIFPSPPAKDEDAVEIYNQAEEEMGKLPGWLWEAAKDPAFDTRSDKTQTLLQDKHKAIALLKEGSRKSRLYHPLTLTFDSEIPRYAPFRNGVNLLALEARNFARKGQMAAALANISDMENIAEQINQTPTLISTMVASAIHSNSKNTLEIILAESPGHSKIKVNLPVKTHDQILQGLQKSLVIEDAMQDFGMADILINHPSMYLFSYAFDESFWGGFENKLYRVFLYPDDLASHGDYFKKVYEFTKQPYYQSGSEFKEWENHLAENIELGIMSSIALPSIFRYFDKTTYHQTEFLLGRLGLASAAYRSDHGKYPATLNALVPKYIREIPKDPFSGEPLKMLAVDGGLILYGVGEDLKDDGGLAYDDINKTGDPAFYLGSAFKEHRLKPAIEKQRQQEAKRTNKRKK